MEYDGAIYHVINRGDRQEEIFRDDRDRRDFLETLARACAKTRWQVHAYCLMHNHFHLVLETPQANLVAGMKWFLGTYTSRFNHRHHLFGHLFSGRYKSLLVDGQGGYLRTVCDYVHLNPVRARRLLSDQPLRNYLTAIAAEKGRTASNSSPAVPTSCVRFYFQFPARITQLDTSLDTSASKLTIAHRP